MSQCSSTPALTGSRERDEVLSSPPKASRAPLPLPAVLPEAMAFFLLIQANDMEQTAVPLPRATNPHRQHSEGFPREGFPSSSQGGWQQSSAIPTSVPSKAPCPQAVVTPWDSTEPDWVVVWSSPSSWLWSLPSPPASLVQLQRQRGHSSRERQPWIPLDLPPETP